MIEPAQNRPLHFCDGLIVAKVEIAFTILRKILDQSSTPYSLFPTPCFSTRCFPEVEYK
jgi:hypothetical protein